MTLATAREVASWCGSGGAPGGASAEHARDDNSYLIGMMDTPELAQSAVDGHNALIESGETT